MGCVHSTAEGVEFDFGNREPAPPPPATHAYRPPSPASSSKKAPVLAHQFQTQQVYHKPKETAAAPPPTPIFHPPLPLDSPHTTPPQQHKKPQQQSPRQKHTKHTYIPPSSLEPAKNNLNQHDKGYDVQNSPPTADKKRLPPQARTSNGTDPLPGAPKRLNTPELFFDEKFDRGTKVRNQIIWRLRTKRFLE